MKVEKIILGVVALALVFKFMHFAGANMILVVSLSTLAMVYFGGGFWFAKGKDEQKRTGLAVIAGMAFSITCMGILFRLLYWPGGKAMLMLPALALPILLAVIFYLKGKENQALETDKKLLIRVVVFAVLAISFYTVSNRALLTIQYPNDPEVVRIKSNHFDHPENEAYTKEYEEYRKSELKK
ncbi:MAG: hypothetical protein K0R51_70 [Cytophagaceae bacterium]|jgi:hypothetical protein|nr:hypothetical protein [Cytophagaceae bacterium]